MTTVRIAHAEPRPGRLPNGGFSTRGFLVVLADDRGHRAVPIWMQAEPGDGDLSQLLELAARPAGEVVTAGAPEELTARLLRAVGARVTGVDIDLTVADTGELTPQVALTRIGLDGPAGTRHVTAGLGLGLALAAAAGAPVRLAGKPSGSETAAAGSKSTACLRVRTGRPSPLSCSITHFAASAAGSRSHSRVVRSRAIGMPAGRSSASHSSASRVANRPTSFARHRAGASGSVRSACQSRVPSSVQAPLPLIRARPAKWRKAPLVKHITWLSRDR